MTPVRSIPERSDSHSLTAFECILVLGQFGVGVRQWIPRYGPHRNPAGWINTEPSRKTFPSLIGVPTRETGLESQIRVIVFPALSGCTAGDVESHKATRKALSSMSKFADSDCLLRTWNVISAGVNKLRQRAIVDIVVSSSGAPSTIK